MTRTVTLYADAGLALAEHANVFKRGRLIDFLLLNAGMVGNERVLMRRVSRRLRPRSSAIINGLSGCSAPTC
jgi:hypothetical protein